MKAESLAGVADRETWTGARVGSRQIRIDSGGLLVAYSSYSAGIDL